MDRETFSATWTWRTELLTSLFNSCTRDGGESRKPVTFKEFIVGRRKGNQQETTALDADSAFNLPDFANSVLLGSFTV